MTDLDLNINIKVMYGTKHAHFHVDILLARAGSELIDLNINIKVMYESAKSLTLHPSLARRPVERGTFGFETIKHKHKSYV